MGSVVVVVERGRSTAPTVVVVDVDVVDGGSVVVVVVVEEGADWSTTGRPSWSWSGTAWSFGVGASVVAVVSWRTTVVVVVVVTSRWWWCVVVVVLVGNGDWEITRDENGAGHRRGVAAVRVIQAGRSRP